jgi:hypothetical protein
MEPQAPRQKKRPIWLTVGGSIVAVVAVAALVGGGIALWADASKRDAHGYFSADAHRYQTQTRAIATEKITLGGSYCDHECDLPSWLIGKVRLEASSAKPLFVGIARSAAVDRYLSGVAHATATELDLEPFDVTYVTHAGTAAPARPADLPFWAASATGKGTTSLSWKVKAGDWSIVVMNADGSLGVSADVAAGVKAPWLLWAGIGIVSLGGVLLGAAALVWFGTGGRRNGPQTAGTPVPAL